MTVDGLCPRWLSLSTHIVINPLVRDRSAGTTTQAQSRLGSLSESKRNGNMKTYFVYIMTNRSRVVLYVGVTNSIERRLWYHGNTFGRSFTKRYKVDRIVYYESYHHIRDAIAREKEIKGWRREKKNDLVRSLNPKLEDLASRMFSDYR